MEEEKYFIHRLNKYVSKEEFEQEIARLKEEFEEARKWAQENPDLHKAAIKAMFEE